jgi:hypothetical protein
MSEWVSVKDRLPSEGGRYWVYVEEITDTGKSHYQWNAAYGEFHRFTETNMNGTVTHWMPLPEPPKTTT